MGETPHFYYDVAPIVESNCAPCHASTRPMLIVGDTREQGANYAALQPFAGTDLFNEMVTERVPDPRDQRKITGWLESGTQR